MKGLAWLVHEGGGDTESKIIIDGVQCISGCMGGAFWFKLTGGEPLQKESTGIVASLCILAAGIAQPNDNLHYKDG